VLLLALALASAQAPGQPAPEPPAEVSPIPAPVEAPEPEPEPAAPPPASAPTIQPYVPVLLGPPPPRVDPELEPAFTPVPLELRPPPPFGRGTGLIVGAAIAGAVNIGLAGARFGLVLGEPTDRNENIRYYLTAIAMPIDVVAGIGLSAGAGHVRGRWVGYRSAYDGLPRLRANTFIQTGAVMLAIGAVGYAMAWIPWQGDSSLSVRGGGTLLVETVSSLVLMSGTGLLTYGFSWRRSAERNGYLRRVGLRPALAPSFAGLAISGRF
jgi:hypothetical protein